MSDHFWSDPFWRLYNRKQKEDIWDMTIPLTDLQESKVLEAMETHRVHHEIVIKNTEQIKNNDAKLESLAEEIDEVESPVKIRSLIDERNKLRADNAKLSLDLESATAIRNQNLNIIHKYRDDIGEFYQLGPYIKESKVALISAPFLVGAFVVGAATYYALSDTKMRTRFKSKVRKSPIAAVWG